MQVQLPCYVHTQTAGTRVFLQRVQWDVLSGIVEVVLKLLRVVFLWLRLLIFYSGGIDIPGQPIHTA